jgi:hypothetical protein
LHYLAQELALHIDEGEMTLRIQKRSDGDDTIVHLSGRLVAADRDALYEQIVSSIGRIALDLEEVTLVDIEIVRFWRDVKQKAWNCYIAHLTYASGFPGNVTEPPMISRKAAHRD